MTHPSTMSVTLRRTPLRMLDIRFQKESTVVAKVPVGIIGCGNISPAYIKGCRTFEILDLVAVADIDMSRAKTGQRSTTCQRLHRRRAAGGSRHRDRGQPDHAEGAHRRSTWQPSPRARTSIARSRWLWIAKTAPK